MNFDKSFKFDMVLDSDASQDSAFRHCVLPVLEQCLAQGRHAAVIAYGQTGAGKTYTMGTDHRVSKSLYSTRFFSAA